MVQNKLSYLNKPPSVLDQRQTRTILISLYQSTNLQQVSETLNTQTHCLHQCYDEQ